MRISAVIGAALVAVLALVTLAGWYTGTIELTALIPGYEAMRPPTARAMMPACSSSASPPQYCT